MIAKSDFYQKCLDMGYTNIDDSEQHKRIELLAMEMNINYSSIDDYFKQAQKEYIQKQNEEREKERIANEEKKRKAINGNFLCAVTTRARTVYVYKRPDLSIYCELPSSGREGTRYYKEERRVEGIGFAVRNHTDSAFTMVPSQTIFTGAVVGGVATGGFHQTKAGYDFKYSKTDKGFLTVKFGDEKTEDVCSIRLCDFASFLYGDKYSDGIIKCMDVDAGKGFNSMVKDMARDNRSVYEVATMVSAQHKMEAYSMGACVERCDFIRWYTQNFYPYEKKDATGIYKAAEKLTKTRTEESLTLASRYFLFIKDYEDAADRAIATRKDIQNLEQERKLEQERIEKEKIEAQRLAREKTQRNIKRTIKIMIPVIIVAIIVSIIAVEFIIPKYKYQKALDLMEAGNYNQAYVLLEELGERELIVSSKHDRALALLESEEYDEAYELLSEIDEDELIASSKHDRALALLESEEYDEAYELLSEIGEDELIASSEFDRAIALIESGEYTNARNMLGEIGDYESIDSERYSIALTLIEEGNCDGAYVLLDGLQYQDSETVLNDMLHSAAWLRTLSVGECFNYGSYEQDNNLSNGPEDIMWRIIDKEEDRILVISCSILDYQELDFETDYTWETNPIREWLNSSFYNSAFSDQERSLISSVTLSNAPNPSYGTSSGENTTDSVFLLSMTEARQYFSSDQSRMSQMTPYAAELMLDEGWRAWNDVWFLRTSGNDSHCLVYVNEDGNINEMGNFMWAGIRPAMWLNIA